MRKLVITQNITLDGSIEMLEDRFDPQLQDEDVLAESHRQDSQADALLVGRQTFEDFRGYWPKQTDDATGVTDYLNRVHKYVVSSTMTDPAWQNSTVLSGNAVEEVSALKSQPGMDIVLTGSISLAHVDRGRVGRRISIVRLPGGAGPRSSPVSRGVLDRSADSGATTEGVLVGHHVAALWHVNACDRTTAVARAVRLAMWRTSSIRRLRNGIGIAMRRKRNGWTAIGRACYRNYGSRRPVSNCSPGSCSHCRFNSDSASSTA